MKIIYKYPLKTIDLQSIILPIGAEILKIQVQHGEPQLWALVDSENLSETRFFETFGTGHPIDDSVERKYVGTYQISNGNLVFHVFERIK